MGNALGEKVRTHCRKARQCYLNFSKKKTKTHKQIQKTKKSLLQYLKRNVNQLNSLVEKASRLGIKIEKKVFDRLDMLCAVLDQGRCTVARHKESMAGL
jgi:hypothetical protein